MSTQQMHPNTLTNTLRWFQRAMPEPTSQNRSTQMGVHFEEVVEMLDEIDAQTFTGQHLITVARNALHELAEWAKANAGGVFVTNRLKYLDSLADQLVTATGCAHVEDMDPVGALDEVNRSNWSKFDDNGQPIFNENRKVMKGPGYSEADLNPFV